MEIGATSAALAAVTAAKPGTYTQAASMAMLDNTIELNEAMAQSTIKMMENSVTPHIGSNIDIFV